MNKKRILYLMFAAAMLFTACSNDDNNTTPNADMQTITVSGIEFTMVKVEPGTFMMGEINGDLEVTYSEKPAHQVTLTKPFYMAKTEVTQELWQAVMGTNPSYFGVGTNLPVEQVSYNEAIEFCSRLSTSTGRTFTLPTEAQWEYAARGGHKAPATPTVYAGGSELNAVGWYTDNCEGTTHEVGSKAPNELGLYDMSGSVREWCLDWYGEYSATAQSDPQGPSTGTNRVARGGGWASWARECRIPARMDFHPDNKYGDTGFRVVMLP